MSELARFQDAFQAALTGDDAALAPWLADDAAGLAVYRNTVASGAVEALAASFPTVQRLVGEAWFRAAARDFALATPPAEPALLAYGAAFPEWIAAFPPAADMPYLGAVARLDRLWSEAHLAAEAEPLDASAFAALDAEALASTTAVLHPSARLAWFDFDAPGLWLANRPPAEPPETFELSDQPAGLLLVRAEGVVVSRRIDAASHAFLAACAAGRPLAEAAAAAMEAGATDLNAIFAEPIEDRLFVSLQPATRGRPS